MLLARHVTVSYASVIATLLLVSLPASAETILYNFGVTVSDGSEPSGPLTLVDNKRICGPTVVGGGARNFGTIYCLTRQTDGSFKETTLVSFVGQALRGPTGKLALSGRNILYGVSRNLNSSHLVGSVFQVTLPRSGGGSPRLKAIYDFSSDHKNPGQVPVGGVVIGADGSLYGSTRREGYSGGGIVFKLTPPASAGSAWTETDLYDFIDPDANVYGVGGLAIDATGTLYGVTSESQGRYSGFVYSLTPPQAGHSVWGYKTLYTFGAPHADNGRGPTGDLLIGPGGVLYGTCALTTEDGSAGNAYSLAPPSAGQTEWQYTKLHTFVATGPGGSGPNGGLLRDSAGNLYGSTNYGGAGYPGAVAFRLTPGAPNDWTETVLQRFPTTTNGDSHPSELTFYANGDLLGTTYPGGTTGGGTAFRIKLR